MSGGGVNDGTCCPNTQLCNQNCCPSGQNCIDPASSTCCPSTQVGCGSTCCGPGQACLDPRQGQCCAPAQICGSTCCDDPLDSCINGTCYPVGTTLCNGSPCNTLANSCVPTAATGVTTCCPEALVCAGQCCSQGQSCVNGACAQVCPRYDVAIPTSAGIACCPAGTAMACGGTDAGGNVTPVCCPSDLLKCAPNNGGCERIP